MTLDIMREARIESFGTNNPKVAQFLKASFALDNLGIGGLAHASETQAQSVGSAMRNNGIGLA